jgi:hypothetical protein
MLDLHRGAFEHDWRARFSLPLDVVGTDEMSWGEALRLTKILTADGSSQVGAAVGQWEYPLTREAQILMDLIDSHVAANFKNAKPYPRPWASMPKSGRAKPDASLTQEEIIAALRRAGHTKEVPTTAGGG